MENKEQEPIKILNVVIRFKNAFFQLWPLVLILTILFGAFTAYRAKSSFVPMYESKAIFTVESGYDADDIFGASSFYDQYAAEQLAAAFPHILPTDMMRDLVIQQLPKGYINGSASAAAVAESNMLVLSVVSNDPQDGYDYLRAIIECFPQLASYIVNNPKVRIVTTPTLATEPYNSLSLTSSALKGAAIGFVAGLLIILVCALLTRTIQTTDELKSSINLPILVALPKIYLKKRRTNGNKLITYDDDPNMTESIRGLRVKLKKMLDTVEDKTILVTSTLAGEGKTTVAINLAYALAIDGHKVLLLDADLRSQSIAKSLGEKIVSHSLMDCIQDKQISILDCIRQSKTENLDYISGRSTDKRHYTIDDQVVRDILKILSKRYDYVIVDTPPCEIVSDTTTLCRCANCVLYVVKQDYAQHSQVLNAVTALHQKDVKIAGCIFNGVPRFHRQYGYGYRSSYGYGYDYGYRKYSYGSKYSYGKYGKYSKYSSKHTRRRSSK